MKIFNFLVEYLKSPRTVGAVAPSSQKLAKKMVGGLDYNNAKCIIEYGPGTGVFTDKLVKKKKHDTVLILFEYNAKFCKQLQSKYKKQDNVIIINDSAENVEMYLKMYHIDRVDYIVSGLPFESLPTHVSNRILEKTRSVLKQDGLFLTFQYTLLKKKYIGRYFNKIELERVLFNMPPAYVFKCYNQK